MHIAQHITTCRSEAARAGSGLSISQHHEERRSPADTVGDFGGTPASNADETSAKAGSLENAGTGVSNDPETAQVSSPPHDRRGATGHERSAVQESAKMWGSGEMHMRKPHTRHADHASCRPPRSLHTDPALRTPLRRPTAKLIAPALIDDLRTDPPNHKNLRRIMGV